MATTVSVIIPALNEVANIGGAVASARQAGADEILVVDGGSRDETVEVLDRLRCRRFACPAGRASQQNAGAGQTGGDILLFLHADNRLGPQAIAQVRAAARSCPPEKFYGAFEQRIDDPGLQFRLLEAGNRLRVRWLGTAYGDQGIFISRRLFNITGGFPSEPLLEDLLLMQALRRRGLRPLLLPGPVIVSPRRWVRHGVFRQTLRNQLILLRHFFGATPAALAGSYRRHDC